MVKIKRDQLTTLRKKLVDTISDEGGVRENCLFTHLHELVVLLRIEVSVQVDLTEGELLISSQLLEPLQLLHDLASLQVLQLLQLLLFLLFLLK